MFYLFLDMFLTPLASCTFVITFKFYTVDICFSVVICNDLCFFADWLYITD